MKKIKLPDEPTFEDLVEAFRALTEQEIDVDDLPLKRLQDKLDQTWRPDLLTMLGPKSIPLTMLSEVMLKYMGGAAEEVRWNIGNVPIPWPGLSTDSTLTVVNHGLGATPDFVALTTTSHDYNVATFTHTSTTFSFRCRSVSGTTPAAGNSGVVFWLAIAVV